MSTQPTSNYVRRIESEVKLKVELSDCESVALTVTVKLKAPVPVASPKARARPNQLTILLTTVLKVKLKDFKFNFSLSLNLKTSYVLTYSYYFSLYLLPSQVIPRVKKMALPHATRQAIYLLKLYSVLSGWEIYQALQNAGDNTMRIAKRTN